MGGRFSYEKENNINKQTFVDRQLKHLYTYEYIYYSTDQYFHPFVFFKIPFENFKKDIEKMLFLLNVEIGEGKYHIFSKVNEEKMSIFYRIILHNKVKYDVLEKTIDDLLLSFKKYNVDSNDANKLKYYKKFTSRLSLPYRKIKTNNEYKYNYTNSSYDRLKVIHKECDFFSYLKNMKIDKNATLVRIVM